MASQCAEQTWIVDALARGVVLYSTHARFAKDKALLEASSARVWER